MWITLYLINEELFIEGEELHCIWYMGPRFLLISWNGSGPEMSGDGPAPISVLPNLRGDELWWSTLEQGSAKNTKERLQRFFIPVRAEKIQPERYPTKSGTSLNLTKRWYPTKSKWKIHEKSCEKMFARLEIMCRKVFTCIVCLYWDLLDRK